MRNITIKICGLQKTGKSMLQYFLIKEMRNQGLNVEFIPDIDFKTEDELFHYFDQLLETNQIKFDQFNVKVETIQTNRSLPIVD
jgi:hypothetical protein